jgi:hypothetical protein
MYLMEICSLKKRLVLEMVLEKATGGWMRDQFAQSIVSGSLPI